ncbi:RNA methyltransferase [Candidatus Nanohalovita haloferacivicina]|uniref:RNA methyltransferase n=1 Tax=Candidatus Nanohalovita haloferacivicina TaxID=2978046 RepID=UPI00325FDC14|nr:tRNA/rRNA methyltransferase [Candidatus Nanohalobia archaeon BNXNv]
MKAVILVEPEIPQNTGSIARLAHNYDYQIRIVNPEFNLEKARKTAKNGQEKLRNAKIYDTVKEAVEDLEYVAGTKPGKGTGLKQFTPRKNTSIMIGRESSGLSNKELEMCDTVIHIETKKYNSLNQSHATAVIMHNLVETEEKGLNLDKKEYISSIVDSKILERLILRANPSESEANQLIGEIKDKFDQS